MVKSNGNGRKPDGTFAPGNPGGPGRPKRATETSYLLALAGVVSIEDMQEIGRKAVQQAKVGDARARDWVSKYLLGDMPLSMALALELVSSDQINHWLLSITGHMIQNDTAELSTIQDIADIMRERRLGRKPTDVDKMLDSIQIGDELLAQQMQDELA